MTAEIQIHAERLVNGAWQHVPSPVPPRVASFGDLLRGQEPPMPDWCEARNIELTSEAAAALAPAWGDPADDVSPEVANVIEWWSDIAKAHQLSLADVPTGVKCDPAAVQVLSDIAAAAEVDERFVRLTTITYR